MPTPTVLLISLGEEGPAANMIPVNRALLEARERPGHLLPFHEILRALTPRLAP